MGRDKALLTVDGQSVLEMVRDKLRGSCDEVLVVARPDQMETFAMLADVRLVADTLGARGPLVGLRAGLAAARNTFIFAVGCDMPDLQSRAVDLIIQSPDRFDVVAPRVSNRWEPLHARYSRRCLPEVDRLLENGVPPIHVFFPRVVTMEMGEKEMREVDPGLRSLTNVNTAEQWEKFNRWVG